MIDLSERVRESLKTHCEMAISLRERLPPYGFSGSNAFKGLVGSLKALELGVPDSFLSRTIVCASLNSV